MSLETECERLYQRNEPESLQMFISKNMFFVISIQCNLEEFPRYRTQ